VQHGRKRNSPSCAKPQTLEALLDLLFKTSQMYDSFDESIHLKPDFQRSKFESLHSWDLGWELLSPINIASDQDDSEIKLVTRLSPGQKALYFFWYLEGQVTNGGFIQFFWNGYGKYLHPILEGLRLISDNEMIRLVEKAKREYHIHEEVFNKQKELDDWEPLYESLQIFDEFDRLYFKIHDHTMSLIERFAKINPNEFVNLVG
jgi:hypothetical protein